MTDLFTEPSLPKLLRGFFCDRLVVQRNASRRTVASYRDAFRLLLDFATRRVGKPPTDLTIEDLSASTILGFLDYLEVERGNSARTRNARLAAIRSFMRYASYHAPEALPTIQRVLAIPTKRFERPLLDFLPRDEMEAVLAAPDPNTWSGQRDTAMFATFYNTGARVSEVVGFRVADFIEGGDTFLRIHGKGRKQRTIPLWRSTAGILREWRSRIDQSPGAPLFPGRFGSALSRSGVTQRLRWTVERAAVHCPSLKHRRISPHTLRHYVPFRTTNRHLPQPR